MIILRYFRFICVSGLVISAISFFLGTVAVATDSWLQTTREVPVGNEIVLETTPWNTETTDSGNISDVSKNGTNIFPTTATPTPVSELFSSTDRATFSTGTTLVTAGEENVTTVAPELKMVIATSGLWHICQADLQDGSVISAWMCSNVIYALAAMPHKRELIYFQSMLAFELISVAAMLAGCCVATVAIYKRQPLAVLVAAFTMFFAGVFMLVGHLMMLSIHKPQNDDTTSNKIVWYYGWSFVMAWLSFTLCLASGIVNCVVYRNFRKMSEELNGTPSRTKYANRQPPPVSLGSSI